MPTILPQSLRAAVVSVVALWPLSAACVQCLAADGPVAGDAPAAVPADPAAAWGDALWDAARRGDRGTVDALLAKVPAGAEGPAAARLRDGVAARASHVEETARKVGEQREVRAKELADAMSKSNAVKALVAAAYLKYLSDDWKRDSARPEIAAALDLADRAIADARSAGDWLYAEELANRARSLTEGSAMHDRHRAYDEALETDIGRRVRLVLSYAPRGWYELRKRQYDRLDEADRKEPFPPFNEKGADDWKQSIEGITPDILREALGRIAAEHLEHVGWKPLIEGGLNMVRLLAETPALKENFPRIGEQAIAADFAAAVGRQLDAVKAMKAAEVDERTFRKSMDAVLAANKATVQLPPEVVVREFGDGAIATVSNDFEDPYTEIVWPDRMRRFSQMIKGNFVGVGILIRHDEKREIVIINPLDGSPAKRMGIKPGDRIIAVNGASTADWPLDKAVDTITGPAGTEVKLSVRREGEEGPLDFPLIREKIKMYSVQGWRKTGYNARFEPQWDWFVSPDDGIAYVRLTGFNEDTFADFLKSMRELAGQRPLNGLILDLRGNPGGLLQSAVSFVNVFMRTGRIVSVEDRDGQELYAFTAERQKAPLSGLPTVVLINEGSASASEIVSGALEAHDAAVVVGERSFGKGSVQEVHEIGGRGLDADANVKYTVQHYLLPPKPGAAKGRLVHKKLGSEDWGVLPDLVVRLSPDQIESINKLRAAADDLPEEAADGIGGVPVPPAGGDAPAAPEAPKEPADPADLVRKGIDPQLELAVLLLQARTVGRPSEPEVPAVAPAARPAAEGVPAKARS
jgi:carboxyl-terminal processing protease